ncbi:MAG: putative tRNA sulfurtransferase [Candidatus Tyloplasma litorale]|nr:MAG: putative tRNA sulfurtransferase [Mycoplasmatales bacterium]
MELNNKYIVVKFSELSLKGGNKKEFVKILIRNIKNKLKDKKIKAEVKNAKDKIEIYSDHNLEEVFEIMDKIVGISSYSYYYKFEANEKNILKNLQEKLSNFQKGTKFRISLKIIQNDEFDDKSKLINLLAWYAIEKLGFIVDLSNYDIDINLRIEKNIAIFFFEKKIGIYGLPAGVNGKALTLLSGGIDSPVAAFKTVTRGVNVSFITFLTPRTSEANVINKIKDLAIKVDEYNGIHGKIIFVNFEKVQEEISKLKDSSYRITLLRRFFVKFAQIISKKYGYKFLITGDSLGQVASQTPESMTQIDNATDQLIIRPLVSMSKNEIIRIAEKIGTYKISIRPGDDMCSLFTPKKPIIFPKKEMVQDLESKLTNMDDILFKILKEETRIIDIKEIYDV